MVVKKNIFLANNEFSNEKKKLFLGQITTTIVISLIKPLDEWKIRKHVLLIRISPRSRALINPSLFLALTILTLGSFAQYSSRGSFRCSISEKSSTKTTSSIKFAGDLSRTEWTVLSRTDQASLWKQMITDVLGRSSENLSLFLHL